MKVTWFLLFFLGFSIQACAQTQSLSPEEYSKKIKSLPNATIVDVRTPGEFSEDHLKNAINIDWKSGDFEKKIKALDKNKPVFVYCLAGGRSSNALKKMKELGFKEVYDLSGGISAWKNAKLPVVK